MVDHCLNSFNSCSTLTVGGHSLEILRLDALETAGMGGISRLPFSIKILLENMLRHENGRSVSKGDIEALARWNPAGNPDKEIAFTPARVLMQDLTGVPALVDLAAMRDAMHRMGGDPKQISPLQATDLVIDHSVQIDRFGTPDALRFNAERAFERNRERFAFLRWGAHAFQNFRVVPPDTGIVHQVNLEYLARVVWTEQRDGMTQAFPDTLVGLDSHTTMINGLGVVGWGVGGIEAEAAMLGQPISILISDVVGVKLVGQLPEGITATDLVLTITQMLRAKGVVGKFVEFYGSGSSRDWAAKGPKLLGVRAVIAQSYERIHRSNLIGMGILPLQFNAGETPETLGLTGFEVYTIEGIAEGVAPGKPLTVRARSGDGSVCIFTVITRIETPDEVAYYRHGGILPYVLRQLLKGSE